jgi:two-component system response regulator HydG
LENTIERAHIIAKKTIQPEHILLPTQEPGKTPIEFPRTLKEAAEKGRERAEADMIRKTLDEVSGNKSEAARRLDVSYKTLLNRIKRYKDKGLL